MTIKMIRSSVLICGWLAAAVEKILSHFGFRRHRRILRCALVKARESSLERGSHFEIADCGLRIADLERVVLNAWRVIR